MIGLLLRRLGASACGMVETRPPRMPADELRRLAEEIYGPNWQSPLARDLSVPLRTVQRWAGGYMQPPDVRAELAAICRREAERLIAIVDRLEGR